MEKIFAPFLTSIFRDPQSLTDQSGICAFYPPFFRGQGFLIKSADKVAQLKKIYTMWLFIIVADFGIAAFTFYLVTTIPAFKDAKLLAVLMPALVLSGIVTFGFIAQKRVMALVANAPVIGQPPKVR
jgi:hypothetical protein